MDPTVADPRVTVVLDQMTGLDLTRVQGVTFESKTVFLDGRQFVGCTFTNCDIRIVMGVFVIEDGTFTGCAFRLYGPAAKVAEVIDTFGSGYVVEGPVQ
jgi:hypothetical protein